MTQNERLSQISLKVERAKKHVVNLNAEIRSFLDSNPYKVGAERDPQTRKPVYYVASVDPTPDCLPLIAGDVIQNLMSALDHLAYQIVCSDTGDRPPNPTRIYFPIYNSAPPATKDETAKQGKMEGAAADSIAAINALKPYKGGNDLLWVLQRLNNIDKHRLLITVGSMFRSINIGAMVSRMLASYVDTIPKWPYSGKDIPVIDAFFRPANPLFPLKVGDILYTDGEDRELDPNLQFRFDVALYEPQIIEAQSILETLHQLTNLVEGIIVALTPRLA